MDSTKMLSIQFKDGNTLQLNENCKIDDMLIKDGAVNLKYISSKSSIKVEGDLFNTSDINVVTLKTSNINNVINMTIHSCNAVERPS